MEFVKVMNGFNRMCKVSECKTCQFKKVEGNCLEYTYEYPAEAEELITEWLETNPVKTYLTEVLKHFPDTPVHQEYGFPIGICPRDLGAKGDCEHIDDPVKACLDCWNIEVLQAGAKIKRIKSLINKTIQEGGHFIKIDRYFTDIYDCLYENYEQFSYQLRNEGFLVSRYRHNNQVVFLIEWN